MPGLSWRERSLATPERGLGRRWAPLLLSGAGRTAGLKLAPDQLAAYDLRIKGYVEQLNRFRTPPIQLKYFQYPAVLFTEIYLDCLVSNRASLLSELNQFVG